MLENVKCAEALHIIIIIITFETKAGVGVTEAARPAAHAGAAADPFRSGKREEGDGFSEAVWKNIQPAAAQSHVTTRGWGPSRGLTAAPAGIKCDQTKFEIMTKNSLYF